MRRIKKKIEKFLNTSELSIIKKLYEFHDKKDYRLILKLLNKKLDEKIFKLLFYFAINENLPEKISLKIFSRVKSYKKFLTLENLKKMSKKDFYFKERIKSFNLFTNNFNILKLFLENDLNPNYNKFITKSNSGKFFKIKNSLLHFNILKNFNKIDILIKYGANPYLLDKNGKTPLCKYIINGGYLKYIIINLLKSTKYIPFINKYPVTFCKNKNFLKMLSIEPIQNALLLGRKSIKSPFYEEYLPFDMFKLIYQLVFL